MSEYYKEDAIREFPDIFHEWMDWLAAQRDPGMYDSFKVVHKDLPVGDPNRTEWVTDIFMPDHIQPKYLKEKNGKIM